MRLTEAVSPDIEQIKAEHLVPQSCPDTAFRLASEFGSATNSIWRSVNYLDSLRGYIKDGKTPYFMRTIRSTSVFPFPQVQNEVYYYRFEPQPFFSEDDAPLIALKYFSTRSLESKLGSLAEASGISTGQALAQAMLIAEEILNHEKKGEELVFLDPEVQKFTLRLSKIGLTREERIRKYLNSLKSKITQRA